MPKDNPAGISLRYQFFGGPLLLSQGVPVALSPLQGAMLGLLLGGPDDSLTREEILKRFWPDEEPTKARRRLNQLLYSIKRRTGEPFPFQTRGDRVLRSTDFVRTDLNEFEDGLASNRLLSSLSLLGRGFLPALEGRVSRSYSDWVAERAAELRGRLRRKAERRWMECEREGEWNEAAHAARVLLCIHPRDETRLRHLMEALGKAGLGEEAVEALQEFRSRAEGAGRSPWTPEPETTALLQRIRSAEPEGTSTRPSRIFDPGDDPPLVGRKEERSLLRRTIRNVPEQELRAILLLGEAGIGKTRLIREALQGIHLEGQHVLSASAVEMEQLIPLNPLIEAFSAPRVGAVLRNLDEPWRTVLFGVMPAHYLGHGPIPEAPQIQPGSVPRRLFEAIHQLLLGLAREAPVILVLEDIQWADQTTLSVLEFLVRRWNKGGLQIVVSVRSEEIHRNATVTPFLETLRSHSDLLEMAVNELDNPTSEALIRGITSKPLTQDDIVYLHSLAGGNPFYLIELTLEFLAGRVEPDSGTRELLQIPLSIRQVLRRRLAQLSPDSEKVLGSLAVHSRPLVMEGIGRIARLSVSRCLNGIDQLNEFRLVASHGAHIFVRHELIRQTVYQRLPEPTRAWLHGRVGHYLLRTRERPPVDELAVHFARAGMSTEAREYGLEAAARAETAGAIPEALRFLRIAREHSSNVEEVAELIGRMGHLHYLHQNLEEAAPLLELAVGRFRNAGQLAQALEAEIERIDSLGQTGLLPLEECLEELRRLRCEAKESGNWEAFQGSLDVEAHYLDRMGDIDGVRRVMLEAGDHAHLGGPVAQCKARAIIALNIYFGSPVDALKAAREAVALSRTTSNNDLALHALNRLIVVLHYQGLLQAEEGMHALAEADRRSMTSGDLILKFYVRLNAAVWHLETGELDLARIRLSAAGDVIRGTNARHAMSILHLNLGELALQSHDFSGAAHEYARAADLLTPTSPFSYRTLVNAGLGLCALHNGNLGEARRREAFLGEVPAFWSFDPCIVVGFKARMLMMRRDYGQALALLGTVRRAVKDRFVAAWLRLTLEEVSILRRTDPRSCSKLIEEALAVADHFNLHVRSRELRGMSRR